MRIDKFAQVFMLVALFLLSATIVAQADIMPLAYQTDVGVSGEHETRVLGQAGEKNGTIDITFTTDENGVIGKSFEFSRTYTLANPDAVFTKFVLNVSSISMALQHRVANMSTGGFVAVDDITGEYNGSVTWGGEITARGRGVLDSIEYGRRDEVAEGIEYESVWVNDGEVDEEGNMKLTEHVGMDNLPGDRYAEARSSVFKANTSVMTGFVFDASDLDGTRQIGFDFSLDEIAFVVEPDWLGGGLTDGWIGTIAGTLSMEWNTLPPDATPEPASLLISGLGLVGVGLVAYRRRRGKK